MYAIVKTGGKQYTVKAGDVFDVEKLAGEVGDKVELPVLFFTDGSSVVTAADELAKIKVEAEIVDHHKGEKKIIFKFKKRKGYKRKKGHRQQLTRIAITNLNGEEAEAPKPRLPKAEQVDDEELVEEQAVEAEATEAEAVEAEAVETEATTAEEAVEDLQSLTVAQLKELAKERDVKIASGARKAEIIEALENA